VTDEAQNSNPSQDPDRSSRPKSLLDAINLGPSESDLQEVTRELAEVSTNINHVASSVQDTDSGLAHSLREVAKSANRLKDAIPAEVQAFFRDRDTGQREFPSFAFGQIVTPEEINALRSQAEITSAHIRTSYADSVNISHIRAFGDFLGSWKIAALWPVADLIDRTVDMVTSPVVVNELLSEASYARITNIEASAKQRLSEIEQVTSKAGQGGLAAAFMDTRNEARRGARYWTCAVFICVLLGIAGPVYALSLDIEALRQLTGLAGLLIKALAGLPFFALAAFSGHVAAQHRETARHLTILTAQIKSVQAYSNELPDQQRLDLMFILGKRAFSDPGFMLLDKGNVAVVPEGASELATQLSNVAGKVPRA
jgi:hypothetical protein